MQSMKIVNKDNVAIKKIGLIKKKIPMLVRLHYVLTSPQGGNFRIKLLQTCSLSTFCFEIEKLRQETSLIESERHINLLIGFKLIQIKLNKEHKVFFRTSEGEKAVNAIKALISRIGSKQAKLIFDASFGENSIKLFLKVYLNKINEDSKNQTIFFTPSKLGKLTLSIPRTIEGMASFEKLNDAGLLVYEDDGKIYMPPVLARNFYRYLEELYDIIKVKIFKRN